MKALLVIGKLCANVFANNFTGEAVGVRVLDTGLDVTTRFKQQVCYSLTPERGASQA